MDSIQRLIQKFEEEERIIRQIAGVDEQARRIAEGYAPLRQLEAKNLAQRAEEARFAMEKMHLHNTVSNMAEETLLARDRVIDSMRLAEDAANSMQLLTMSNREASLDNLLKYNSYILSSKAFIDGLMSAREAVASGHELILRLQKDNKLLAPPNVTPGIHSSWLSVLPHETAATIMRGSAIEAALAAEEEARRNHSESIVTSAHYFNNITKSIGQLYSSFNSLADDLLDTQKLLSLPSCTLPGASREIIVASYVYREQYEKQESGKEHQNNAIIQIKRENIVLPDLLENIDPDLAQIHRGASQAITSQNPDRVRHVMSSCRDLWTHVFESLIPDDLVLLWLKDNYPRQIANGKPTRKGRLLYIEQSLASGKLAEFIEWDITAIVKYWQGLNQVHRKTHDLSDDQLQALMFRSDTYLLYIICLVKGISIN